MGQGFESLQACQFSGVSPSEKVPVFPDSRHPCRESGFARGSPSSEGTLAGEHAPGKSADRPNFRRASSPRSFPMVGVVQLVEHRIVVPSVAGSSPVTHPINLKAEGPERPLRPLALEPA